MSSLRAEKLSMIKSRAKHHRDVRERKRVEDARKKGNGEREDGGRLPVVRWERYSWWLVK